MTLETLLRDKELKESIKDLVSGSGRSYPMVEEVNDQETGELTLHSLENGKKIVENGVIKVPCNVNAL